MSLQSDFAALAGRALASEGAYRQALRGRPAEAGAALLTWYDDVLTPALQARLADVQALIHHPAYHQAHEAVWRDSITLGTTAAAAWLPIAVRY